MIIQQLLTASDFRQGIDSTARATMRLVSVACLLLLAAAFVVYAEEQDVTELKIETTRE